MNYSLGKSLLRIENVCLEYDGKPVLKNVNGEIKNILTSTGKKPGQVVGFLGPSGIGKTQLFRIIAGLNKPTSGKVCINEKDRSVIAGEVGVVAQSYPLFDHRTVFSNLMVSAMQNESNSKIAREKVVEYLNEFNLIDKAHHYPAQLSGGQRQRCAIIQQALCSEHFLLMDEPFSGLDPLMLDKTCQLLNKLASKDELNTIIVVTHDITAAASISNHLWLMGRDSAPDGTKIPGSRIMKEYNLIERDLCWHPEIMKTSRFYDFVREVKEEFKNL